VTIIARHDKVGPNKVLHSETASPSDQTHMITFGGIARPGPSDRAGGRAEA